jgi:ribosomal protein S18 acetylase RimI-like enzyme
MELSVRAMTQAEFDKWYRAVAKAYGAAQVAAGGWAEDEALDLALRANAALLPDGLDTEGTLLLKGVRADGTVVGTLWIALTHPRGTPDCAYLYDIEIEEKFRGAGYGRALLTAGESAVRGSGVGSLELNVFGRNTRAIRLYEAAGYAVIAQQMRKEFRSGPAWPPACAG